MKHNNPRFLERAKNILNVEYHSKYTSAIK